MIVDVPNIMETVPGAEISLSKAQRAVLELLAASDQPVTMHGSTGVRHGKPYVHPTPARRLIELGLAEHGASPMVFRFYVLISDAGRAWLAGQPGGSR